MSDRNKWVQKILEFQHEDGSWVFHSAQSAHQRTAYDHGAGLAQAADTWADRR